MTTARKQMTDAEKDFKAIMQENLFSITDDMIDQLMRAYKKLPRSEQPNAVNQVTIKGHGLYKEELKAAAATVSWDAILLAIDELGMEEKDFKFSEVILGDFEKLPKGMKIRVSKRVLLTIGAELTDLEKNLYFEYLDEIDRTDSALAIEESLRDASKKYIEGSSVSVGAQLLSSYTVNDSRSSVFFSEEGKAGMDALQFQNPSPVADICINLNGQIFDPEQGSASQYFPPLHFGCKSVLIPIPKGKLGKREVTKLRPTGTPTEISKAQKSKQFSEDEVIVKCPCCG